MNPRHRAARAFTLIELLIVASILPVIGLGAYKLIAAIESANVRLAMRMDAAEEAGHAARRWRADIALAARVEIAEAGAAMRVTLREAGGGEIVIRYAVNEMGDLTRTGPGEGSQPETLARGVEDLRFSSVGQGFKLAWRVTLDDALTRVPKRFAAFATPLAPAKDSEGPR